MSEMRSIPLFHVMWPNQWIVLYCVFCFGRVKMGETGSKVVLKETSVDGVQPQVISIKISVSQPKHILLCREIVLGWIQTQILLKVNSKD